MDSQIIKIQDKKTNQFLKRYIFGLNIFHVNKVTNFGIDDLQLEFLRNICLQNQVSGNTGSLYDFGHTPEDIFGNTIFSGKYKIVDIGCYRGLFYDSKDWNLFPPLFFPVVESDFLNLTYENNTSDYASLIYSIIYCDALAFFIAPKTENSIDNLSALLKSPFTSSDDFVEEALKLFELVMTTQADGDYFTFYSQKIQSFELINDPLNNIAKFIENSTWYKDNASKLFWDGKYSMCLCLE